mgnify:CR=1 FL=1
MNLGTLNYFLIFIFLSKFLLAETIAGNYAVFKLLDKTTNKVTQKDINVNSKVNWDTLSLEIFACYSTLPQDIPEDYVLIEVKDALNDKNESVYKGWMISSSPDVTPLEHPIYDLWLIDCRTDKTS